MLVEQGDLRSGPLRFKRSTLAGKPATNHHDLQKYGNEYARRLNSYVNDARRGGEIQFSESPDNVLDLVFAVLDGVCIAALLNPEGYSNARATRIVETLIERLSSEGRQTLAAKATSPQRKRAKGAVQ